MQDKIDPGGQWLTYHLVKLTETEDSYHLLGKGRRQVCE